MIAAKDDQAVCQERRPRPGPVDPNTPRRRPAPGRSATWRNGKAPSWAKSDGADTVIFRTRVYENNAIDKHARDHRYMTVYWRFGKHGAGVSPTVTREGEEGRTGSDAESSEVVSRYGIVDADAGPIEQTLWEIKGGR
ncbi:hypothetical protein [Streptomyces collinus]|uniref:hypothetical protein n=1 Tax=Streptomyces collinus TaxID=42684 RepID=UPI0033D1DA55